MLATILKSKKATEATLAIIETFSKIRALSRNVKELSGLKDGSDQKALMQKSGELIAEVLDDDHTARQQKSSIIGFLIGFSAFLLTPESCLLE
jgi:Asp-tRNA(Asn)/Glu-tRNA(Gln) amidotransferase B subunit